MSSELVLHLLQASMEAFDPSRQATSDFEAIFNSRPNVAGLTEVTKGGLRDELLAVAKRHNYRVRGGPGDTALAVRGDHRIRDHGWKAAHGGGRDEFGAYGPRVVDWAQLDIEGEHVTVAEAHWIRPKNNRRRILHRLTTDIALEILRQKSTGFQLAFLMGDLNEDDNPTERPGSAGARMDRAGVTTIWDELHVYPTTGPGGGTIDLLASVDADTRAQAVGVHVWRLLNADHPRVAGFYSVRRRSS